MNQFQSLDEIIGAVKRRFWIMAAIVLLGCGLAVYYALTQTKVYEATAVVQIEAPEVAESVVGVAARTNDTLQRVKLIEQRLTSRDNLISVIEKYDLFDQDPDASINERVGDMRGSIGIEQIMTTAQAWMPGGVPSALVISVQLDDPEKARDVANELMYNVIDASRANSIERARSALDLLSSEENRVASEIDDLEGRVATFKQSNSRFLEDGLDVLRDELGELRQTAIELDQQVATIQSGSTRQRGEVAAQNIALLEDQRRVIQTRIEEINDTISSAPTVVQELNGLERELKRKQDQYSAITRRKAEAELGQLLEQQQKGVRFEVLETALLPEAPISRSRRQIAMLGGVLSLMAAAGVGLLLELLNPALRTPAQMDRALGIAPIVAIPRVSVRRERMKRRALKIGGVLAALLVVPLVYKMVTDRMSNQDMMTDS